MTDLQPDPWGPFTVGSWPARWAWMVTDPAGDNPGVRLGATPCGVELVHDGHSMLLTWVPTEGQPDGQPFTVESLFPLTVVEPVACPRCQIVGRIEAGAWMPAEGGERG